MKDDLQFFKWETNSIFWANGRNLNIVENGRRTEIFENEDNLNIVVDGKQPQQN
jgi:hypothetical protein